MILKHKLNINARNRSAQKLEFGFVTSDLNLCGD